MESKFKIRNPITVLLLTLVTCGIYYIYWIYTISGEQKEFLNDDTINPAMDAVLSLVLCCIYPIFWMYKQGERLKRMYAKKGQQIEDEGTLYLILALFAAPVGVYLIQEKLNKIYQS